jgi:quinol monooxygenase YgiN
MYGTIARMKIKPGSLDALTSLTSSMEGDLAGVGWLSSTIYQSDGDPNELWLAVVFESKEAYHKNAQSPAQNERFTQMRALLEADPEWHDGMVVSRTSA